MDPAMFGLGLVKACFGLKWNKRISNGNGEFAYVINGSINKLEPNIIIQK